jgi:UDP-N-acetylmuramoyl-L-alanyl-D-glutamate--2,6-diaminopimelate ligase
MRPLLDYSISVGQICQLLSAESLLDNQITFSGITSDDRNILPGDLFLAYPGMNSHGAQFAQSAIAKGARAVLTDTRGAEIAHGLPMIIASNVRVAGALVSAHLYGRPMQEMESIAITGTNGKTTVSTLLHQLLQSAGRDSGLIGTVETLIGRQRYQSERTTPEADSLQAIAAAMSEQHMRHLVMEVSSHAMVLNRMQGSHFAIAGFTNLTQDHLDFHGDMESYYLAKAGLFTLEYADKAFINIDDPYGLRLFNSCTIPATSLSQKNVHASWHYTSIVPTRAGTELTVRGAGGILIQTSTPLRGSFNLDNVLLVLAIATECGIDPLDSAALLPSLYGAPGRMEQVDRGQSFGAFVDYAHTPDAVRSVLTTAKTFTQGRVIAVLGCGGDRDTTKRPLMGKALSEGSSISIFTSDNPRSENPEEILAQMTSDVSITQPSAVIADRATAISYAVSLCQPGDTLLILGKGHENGQEIAGQRIDFDDRLVLADAIEAL